ncbi:MAG: type VI secretion system-associated protein TagF [Aromatoleum sp.]|jgi:type VI secretion system protein ImpM|uniref:type VI secretion system-associated protein TagF n=1 Tax=Aromatoleum sp. TaxID=2307007 RepID=UPI002894238D|nr:type VI secretion system-associated protein TagF [Aromatoleum sp.]MDT3669933.1 type VI secretion system-associated protein TagF [Aromatoleum sp.]
MSIGFIRGREVQPQFAIFGKVARRDDFVRVNADHSAVVDFDTLLGKSLAWSSAEPGWTDESYLARGCSEFHFGSDDGRSAFFGVLRPSRDRAGRLYPLVAGVVLPALRVGSLDAERAVANELFLLGLREQLDSAVANASELIACRQYLEAHVALLAGRASDFELASTVLARHLHRTPAASLQRDLLDATRGPLEAHLLAFLFYVSLARRYAGSAPRQVMLLPLPARAGEDALGWGAWLALYRAATRVQGAPIPQGFVVELAGRRYLALAPHGLSERFLGLLWGRPPDAPSVIDMHDDTSPWCRHHAYVEAAYILGGQLADPSLSLHGLCGILEQLACSIG